MRTWVLRVPRIYFNLMILLHSDEKYNLESSLFIFLVLCYLTFLVSKYYSPICFTDTTYFLALFHLMTLSTVVKFKQPIHNKTQVYREWFEFITNLHIVWRKDTHTCNYDINYILYTAAYSYNRMF
jgi:hypothetical protein